MNVNIDSSDYLSEISSAQTSVVQDLKTPSVLVNSANQIVASSDSFYDWALLGVDIDNSAANKPYEAYVLNTEILQDIAEVIECGIASSRVVSAVRSSLNDRYLEVSYHKLIHNESNQCSCLIHFSDVTERTIEHRRLLSSNDELTQLQYHLSHDLVAPIASAKGLLGLLKEDIATENYSELAELSEETELQLKRLSDLVKDLMSLARAGAQTAEISEFNLRLMVDDIVHSISLHARVLETSVTLDCDQVIMHSDRIRVKQILMNLISNARKFIDPSEEAPEIVVTAETVNSTIRIRVSDNGLGVDSSISDSLFGMFIRGVSVYPGHGLGLYIVKKHVDHLNGSVRLLNQSKPTVFEVSIPDASSVSKQI